MPVSLKTPLPKVESISTATQGVDVNAYIGWFEKINLNTLVWQLIFLVVLLSFHREIRALLVAIISKIPRIKAMAGVEFLSDETAVKIAENELTLSKQVKQYMADVTQDPNIVFLSNYINSERDLIDLYMKAFKLSGGPILDRTDKIIKELVDGKFLKPSAINIYSDIRQARNKIAHGQKVFSSFDEAEKFLKAVILLNDMVKESLGKVNK